MLWFRLVLACCLCAALTPMGSMQAHAEGEDAQSQFNKAVRYYIRGDLSRAKDLLETLDSDPRMEDRVRELRRAIQLEWKDHPKESSASDNRLQEDDVAEALCELGFSYTKEGDLDRAEELFVQAEKKAYKYLPACVALAEVYGRQGRIWKSVRKWEEAVAMAGENPSVEFGFAMACSAAGDTDEAISVLEKLTRDPELGSRAGAELGRILWQRKSFDEAKRTWERSIAASPNDGFTFFVIAECCSESGDVQGARIGYSKAMELGYQSALCRKRLTSLKR